MSLWLPGHVEHPDRALFWGATGIFVVEAVGLWVVRHRQRVARDQTIVEVQTMLQDVINNQLVVVQMADQINRRKPGTVPEDVVERAVGVIYEAVASLSDDSLHAWTQKYRQSRRRHRVENWMVKLENNPQLKQKLEAIVPGDLSTQRSVSSPQEPRSTEAAPSSFQSSQSQPVSSQPLSSRPMPYSDIRQVKRDEEESAPGEPNSTELAPESVRGAQVQKQK